MKIIWHGHSCISIETISGYRILVDPFITGNPTSDLEINRVKVDTIILTHAHADHVGDTVALAKRSNCDVICNVELADYLKEKHNLHAYGMNIGGQNKFVFGTVKFTQAIHSSSYEGQTLGVAAGVLISDEISTIYHAGDTALFSDLKLLPPVNCAFLPIGDYYTMGIDDAIKAATLIDSEMFIPIHYNTFSEIEQNPYEFINKLPDANGMVPEIGEEIEL